MRRTFWVLGAVAAIAAGTAGCNGGGEIKAPAGMVIVKAGSLRMGYDGPGTTPSEKEIRHVSVKTFFIDKLEVTNADYLKFCVGTNASHPSHWKGKIKGNNLPAELANLPVVNVSYGEAAAYAKFAGKRLPTEEEWEYAARGPKSLVFPWGNGWEKGRVNTFEQGNSGPVAVGRYAQGVGPFGTLDQAGNVWEWTASVVPGTTKHLIKGGSFAALEAKPRPSIRGKAEAKERRPNLGFRCAKDAGS